MAQHEILLQFRTTQIEMAMTQAQFFGRHLFSTTAGHRQRGRDGWANHAQRRHAHFDRAGLHVRILPLRLARDDLAFAQHHRLDTHRGGHAQRLGIAPRRPERQLHEPRAVAQVDEDEAAQIAASVHPSAKANGTTNVLQAQEAAGVSTKGCGEHGLLWQRRHVARRSGRGESGT